MTTHEGHDHPATKAARAACRRAVDESVARHPAKGKSTKPKLTVVPAPRKATQKVEREVVSEILTTPHPFNPHDVEPTICLNCGRVMEHAMHNGM